MAVAVGAIVTMYIVAFAAVAVIVTMVTAIATVASIVPKPETSKWLNWAAVWSYRALVTALGRNVL